MQILIDNFRGGRLRGLTLGCSWNIFEWFICFRWFTRKQRCWRK